MRSSRAALWFPIEMPASFENLHPHPSHGLRDLLRWKLGVAKEPAEVIDDRFRRETDLQPREIDLGAVNDPSEDLLQVTWIGHASFLIQTAGQSLLFDPVLGSHCAPLRLPSLKRLHPAALTMESLPAIDALFLSHNHYDHLEKETVLRLGAEVPCHVPSGLAPWLASLGVRECREFRWWDTMQFGELTVHCVPAQHFSARGLHDRNRTLWCGWVIEVAGTRIYFAGDSGYAPLFREIRERLGPMDLSILPIGAYRPRWFMRPVHVDPAEAVQVHRDVESRLSIASHWGTFRLTDEPLDEPPALLRQVLDREGLPPDQFRVLQVGETLQVPRIDGARDTGD